MPHKKTAPRNVLGTRLEPCSLRPLTGFFRDGCCNTSADDVGSHTVCAVMTLEFLEFSRRAGNDLVAPRPDAGFPGLQQGDRWCVCATRWLEAFEVGMAPPVVLEATHERALEVLELQELKAYRAKV
ncbi:DUF2237 domain-containing protein [Roseospira marina]|uniref:DUF2237 domain-containing protein n=1 Tax=Roseospira marina TaxID=140057 RepID=A0A5M6IHI0_9PROT|nr:DUF2237 domain-containing protein [Roseospira marina]KAA5607018.1 DUF2237 domain-containing protein [Roseospira marina]MBB4312797.1 hypothetical protein [Roseospira marina]MBB5086430.1 hypothetical protein [Roseospira marina]